MPNPRIWQPIANPTSTPRLALHNLTVRLLSSSGEPSDGLTVRFGLRIVATSGRDILLNGAPLKLKGFNRHDMYPQLGPSLPLARYEADLDEVQKLHGNFIRGCRAHAQLEPLRRAAAVHARSGSERPYLGASVFGSFGRTPANPACADYPQDQRFLDLCDERGILVWNEALAWGNYANKLTDPRFMAAELGTAHAMLSSAANHPSVIMWGFFNEGQSGLSGGGPTPAAPPPQPAQQPVHAAVAHVHTPPNREFMPPSLTPRH